MEEIRKTIERGEAVLGIEFGSTRIKAVLVDSDNTPIAQGAHEWENRYVNGLWTYTLEDIHEGLRKCYADLAGDVRKKYGVEIRRLGAIGVSAMMHGYMPFDSDGRMLTGFRTWRNTNTGKAAAILSEAFNFNIPLRWSVAHLFQAVLDREEHVADVAFITTLAGYVHWLLTGEKVIGIDDGSGMFPVNPETSDYDGVMMERFEALLKEEGYEFRLKALLPKILMAGENAGHLTEEGAGMLDPTGKLQAGIPFCPPEGDAGTGMVATNAVRPGTGNVSAGTSSFSMIVLERNLSRPYEIIDIVATPDGKPVAMVHCNNCTSDLNDWVGLFAEVTALAGAGIDKGELFGLLYREALKGDPDCGGMMAYNFLSGEPIAGVEEGRPLFMRLPDARMSLANFMKTNLYSALACLKIGNDLLFNEEKVRVDRLMAHGGLFKTPEVGQQILADSLDTPVAVMETAGEGGAWGMALLASYMIHKEGMQSLPDFLDSRVFAGSHGSTMQPQPEGVESFNHFLERFSTALPVEKSAVKHLKR